MKQIDKLLLPIDNYLDEIVMATCDYSTVIVKASPGSGKTTRIPWAVASKLNKKVAVLEPRRLAAKLAAIRICDEENLPLGQEVGYHFRFEKKIDKLTRLIFYTEGTFLKKFLTDILLSDVDVVILDEFHERHLDTDLCLAILRNLQLKRPDLKLIIMSATLDLELMRAIPESKVFEINASMFPVEITYLPNQPSILNQSLETKVKKALDSINDHGDVLIFLPGMREMLRVQNVLGNNTFLLHADLSKEEQEAALGNYPNQKIILASNIAESSVTIPGIRYVIDSGIQREAHYSPWNGLKFIKDVPTTKSSAIQRAGRAGRTGPGKCFRLYSEMDFKERKDHTIAEIKRADLTDIHLFITSAKLSPNWFEEPSEDKWHLAQNLLEKMGAIEKNNVTQIGQSMLDIPLDSRLSRIMIAGKDLTKNSMQKLIHYLCNEIEKDPTGRLANRLKKYSQDGGTKENWEQCLLTGFIDQVAKYRPRHRDFIHTSGKIIKPHHSLNIDGSFYLILDLTQKEEAIKVFPIEEEWLWDISPFPFSEDEDIEIKEDIIIKKQIKLGSILIEETSHKTDYDQVSNEIKSKICKLSINLIKKKITSWKESTFYGRIHFVSKSQEKDSDDILEKITPEAFFEYSSRLNSETIHHFLIHYLGERIELNNLDNEFPQKINLGGKRDITIHYPHGMGPFLEAPIQDFYGLNETPTITSKRIALTLKLLGPHKRPIQVTKDLTNFWKTTYQEMKKEYQREYPRHYWPDKPWEAKPILLKSQLPKA
jgi:ATP-dependent helicase HrpB